MLQSQLTLTFDNDVGAVAQVVGGIGRRFGSAQDHQGAHSLAAWIISSTAPLVIRVQ